MKTPSLFLLGVLALLPPTSRAQDAGGKNVDFARDIQPLFKASCLKCHGPEKPKGQFRLDEKALAMKGGVTGKDILPGNSKDSLMMKLLLSADEEERMPQKSPALSREKIDLIRAWIDQGAVWPDASGDAKLATHWAYVKPVRRDPPAVRNAAWI